VFKDIKGPYGEPVFFSIKIFFEKQDIEDWLKKHLLFKTEEGIFVCDRRDGSIGILKN
jgi:hypothetical protein